MTKILKALNILVVLFFLSISQFIFAQTDLFIRDILDSPQKYYNLQVQVQGDVVDVKNAPDLKTRGYYVLMDNSDKTIKVVANSLPAPNKKFIVVGIVQVDTTEQIPYLREINRIEAGAIQNQQAKDPQEKIVYKKSGLSFTVVILIALIIVVTGILLYILFKKPGPQSTASTKLSFGEQPLDEKTKQVSVDDVNQQAGGLKTKQVPDLLAELKIMSGDLMGKNFPLGYETKIGRIYGDIILSDASISREHAMITFTDGSYVIENKSDTNPIIINGEKIAQSKILENGDEIVLGIIKIHFNFI
jgi:hypothetical protein